MRRNHFVILLITLLLIPVAGSTQVVDTAGTGPIPEGLALESVWSMGLRLFLTLALVIGVIFAFVWLSRRLMAKRWPGGAPDRPVRLLDRVHLAPKRSLDVVSVGERVILLGTTETNISFLTELSAEELTAYTRKNIATGPDGKKFNLAGAGTKLRRAFQRSRQPSPEISTQMPTAGFGATLAQAKHRMRNVFAEAQAELSESGSQ